MRPVRGWCQRSNRCRRAADPPTRPSRTVCQHIPSTLQRQCRASLSSISALFPLLSSSASSSLSHCGPFLLTGLLWPRHWPSWLAASRLGGRIERLEAPFSCRGSVSTTHQQHSFGLNCLFQRDILEALCRPTVHTLTLAADSDRPLALSLTTPPLSLQSLPQCATLIRIDSREKSRLALPCMHSLACKHGAHSL